jgi:hypothetical protein
MHLVKAREQLVCAGHELGSTSATARTWRTVHPVARRGMVRYQAE